MRNERDTICSDSYVFRNIKPVKVSIRKENSGELDRAPEGRLHRAPKSSGVLRGIIIILIGYQVCHWSFRVCVCS